jgi:hypothetical protein
MAGDLKRPSIGSMVGDNYHGATGPSWRRMYGGAYESAEISLTIDIVAAGWL